MACPSCGTTAPPGARFCAVCGSPLERRTDERRLVTVLFADLVGYTTLAETRDPESVKNQVDACFERLVSDIADFGGVVDKIIGDAIVAIFGAPVAHEDDPERAVRAALRLHETMAAADPELKLRVGVNTGEVLFGALRAGGDTTVMGDVVNTASRLQTLAAPGQVLVGPATHAATSAAFQYESLGLLRAKGRDEPVPAWVAQSAIGLPGLRHRSVKAPLFGRDAELGQLRQAFATTALRRRAAVFLLIGEAGAGKTRLAEELVLAARAEGANVLEGRCVPYGEVNVWAPLAEALRRAAGVLPDDSPEVTERKARSAVGAILDVPEDDPEVERLLAGISQLMGKAHVTMGSVRGRPSPSADESEAVIDEVLYPVQVCLERMCSRRPLLMVVGELHWADDVLLTFLDRLLERITDQPVMLLATARPELLERWEPAVGRHNRAVLHVDPLDAEASVALLVHLAGTALTADQRQALVERSGGNPLWLEELAALDAPDGDEAPATLRGMVAARLDRLDPSARAVLEDAAVRGRSGTVAALRGMAEAAGRRAPDAELDELAAAGLLSLAHAREGWELRSELVREVAYGTLSKAERARRHARFAAWLADRAGQDVRDDLLDDLAHHWSAAATLSAELGGIDGIPAGTTARALEWVRRAADRALQQELWLPAAALLDTAVLLAEEPALSAIMLDRAEARASMHDVVGATEDLAAVHVTDGVGEVRKLVVAGDVARLNGSMVEAERLLQEALDLSRRVGDVRLTVRALHRLALARIFAGDDAGASSVAEEALVAARAAGDRRGEAWALQHLAWSSFSEGALELAEARLNESAEVFAEIGDWGGHGWATGLLAFVRLSLGDLEGAELLGRQVLEDAERTGERWAIAMMRTLVGCARLWLGAPAEAIEFGQQAAKILSSLGDAWGAGQALLVLGRAHVNAGDIVQGRATLEDALTLARRLEDHKTVALIKAAALVTLALQVGDPEGALAIAPADEDIPYAAGDELAVARAVAHLQAGRVAEASRLVAPLLGWEAADSPPSLRPPVAPWVVFVLLAAGRVADGRAVLDAVDPAAPTTYLDRAWLLAARAACDGEPLSPAQAIVDGTGDVLAQANFRLAADVLGGGVGDGTPWATMWSLVRRPIAG